MKPQNVVEEDWDYLLVLDACRWDFFSEIYDEYLDGTLEKRRSLGSSTPEWAAKTFTEDHDISYYSANPFINSLGIPLNEMEWGASCDYDWTASNHFREVHDLWRDAWDDDLGTVPPDNVSDAVPLSDVQADGADRTVIHYLQPHAPYIGRGKGRKLSQIRDGVDAETTQESSLPGPIGAAGTRVRTWVEQILAESELAQKLGMWIELNPSSIGDLTTSGTRETVEKYYEENLRIVLESVANLVEQLDGTVVVTADHGEAFGEQGIWEHHIETHIPVLVEVPWLEVS
jgi:hypothetical protein